MSNDSIYLTADIQVREGGLAGGLTSTHCGARDARVWELCVRRRHGKSNIKYVTMTHGMAGAAKRPSYNCLIHFYKRCYWLPCDQNVLKLVRVSINIQDVSVAPRVTSLTSTVHKNPKYCLQKHTFQYLNILLLKFFILKGLGWS